MDSQQTHQASSNDNQIDYPNATAVLIDDDSLLHQQKGSLVFVEERNADAYASAQVIERPVCDHPSQSTTEIQVDAVPLDPWNRERTTATEFSDTNYDNNPFEVITPCETRVSNIPSAMLELPLQKKLRRQKRRRARMIAVGATGFVVGSILLGPIGGALIGGASAGITKSVNKRAERKKDKRVMRQFRQRQAI